MGRKRKVAALNLLRRRDEEGLRAFARSARASMRTLFSLTYSGEELIRWRAVEAVGIAARVVADDDVEKVRIFLRGLFWLMNDESGGIGWSAPEAIGEVLFRCPELMGEFGDLLPQYLVEEPFERGTHFALFRLRHVAPELVRSSESVLGKSLGDPDPAIRAYAFVSLAHVGSPLAAQNRQLLGKDRGKLEFYDFQTGAMCGAEVGELLTELKAICL